MSEGRVLMQASRRISRALRQERRMQAAHAAEIAETERLGFVRGRLPDSVQALNDQFEDELYFLMLAVRQTVSSCALLAEKGFTLPPIRMEQALIAWRNIYEHWDDEARGKEVRAKKKWAGSGAASGDPGGTWTFNDTDGITEISGISLIDLRQDLAAVLDVVQDLKREAFEADWRTVEAAAVFMQMDVDKFQRRTGWGILVMDWSHRGAGLWYRQSDLEKWKAKLIAQGDWPPQP